MDTIIVKLLSDTLKFFGALLLTLILCCLSMYATPDAVTNVTSANSAMQPSAVSVTTSIYNEILARMLNANNCYRTLSYDFYECDLSATPEPLVTMASVWIVREPVAMIRIVKHAGFQHQPKCSMEVVRKGGRTLAYYDNPQAGDLAGPESPDQAGHANETITQLPGWGDIDLAIHPEALVRNKVFDQPSVAILGNDQIGGRTACKIRVNTIANGAPQPGSRQLYWIDTQTGIILRSDTYSNGSLQRSFILGNIALNQAISPDVFQIHALNEKTGQSMLI